MSGAPVPEWPDDCRERAGRDDDACDRVLLHCCCGPCAEFPLLDLEQKGIRPLLYYANPNIHPVIEWRRRREALAALAAVKNLKLLSEDVVDEEAWLRRGSQAERCFSCYELRMWMAAKKAAESGCKYFTTTLLVSPYQNREGILAAGRKAACAFELRFVEADWREGFRDGQRQARADGLYCQKYCGCLFSLRDSKFYMNILAEQEAFLRQSCPEASPRKLSAEECGQFHSR